LPKIVLPLISIFTCLWKSLFVFALLLVWLWCTGHEPSEVYLALPLLLLLEFGVILATSLPLAALTPYFPDARVTMDSILRSLMLVSGIFFSVDKVPAEYHFYFYLNPMACLIEAFRAVLLYGQWPNWNLLAWVATYCVVLLVFTLWFYVRIDRSVVKAIHC
jgi:lipopolysaccharide transport system permease protein